MLDRAVEPNFSSRLLMQFNADSAPVTSTSTVVPVVTTTYATPDYEVYYLPDETSTFLIRLGSEADDLADRYNALLQYTQGLLRAIDQTNQVSVVPVKQ